MVPGATRAVIGGGAAATRSANAMASGVTSAYRAGAAASGASGLRAASAGLAGVARSGASVVGQRVAAGAKAVKDRMAAVVSGATAPAAAASATDGPQTDLPANAPAWATRLQRNQRLTHGASTAAHTLRSGDHGGSGASPSLRDDSNH